MILKKSITNFFESSLGKKILNYCLIIFWIFAIIHFSWFWKIIIDKVSGLSTLVTSIHREEESLEVQKTEEYLSNLKTFDNKMINILKYYISDNDNLCYQEIKEYKGSLENTNLWFNINYIPLINGSTELKRIIVCNIYNSTIWDIYIEIPYELTEQPINKTVLDFIELYSKKGYRIHLIYRLDKITDIQKHRNVMKFISNSKIKTVTLIYWVWTNEKLDQVYKLLLSLRDFYEENYWWSSTVTFNFWVDFKYKNSTDYQATKLQWEKSWYELQWYSIDKKLDLETLTLNDLEENQIIWENTIITVKDDFFESFGNKKVNFTDELIKYLTLQKDLFEKLKVKGNLLFNINIKKRYVDIIDWSMVKQLLNYKNITLIIPNSQALVKNISYDEQVERLIKQYEKILSEKDILLLYYKYRNLYLESKLKK